MNIVIPKPVNEVLNILYENNYEAYLIGGTIRNMIMGEKPKNYNISTNANIGVVKKLLSSYNTYLTGENDSTLVIINGKFPMEITKFRSLDNTLESDLANIDFTMNALAYSDEEGLIDYSTGILDISGRVIRLNGNDDELLKKDPLRILRAIRLSSEYTMRVDIKTQEYMFDNRDLLKNVAPERIRDELCKLLVTPRCEFYLKKYFDIFVVIIPELALMENYEQNDPHHIYDALEHTFVTLKCSEPTLDVRLACLFHDIGKPFTYVENDNGTGTYKDHEKKSAELAKQIMQRLKFGKKQTQRVAKLIEYHDYKLPSEESAIKDFLTKFGPENIDDLYKIKKANTYAKNPAYISDISELDKEYDLIKQIKRKASFIMKKDLKITGKDLIDLGIPEDRVGETLDEIYNQILSSKLKNNHDKIIDYINEKKNIN